MPLKIAASAVLVLRAGHRRTHQPVSAPSSVPPPTALQRLPRLLLTLLIASAAGSLCLWLHTPLPWMIGPLLATSLLSVMGVPLQGSRRLRNAGQWIIGIALGLYFTPTVAHEVAQLAPWMLLGAAWSLLLGHLFYRWLMASQPAGTVDASTAYFASVLGGASEMASFAERHGARMDLVASAHSLRMVIVVVTIPFAYQAAGIHGADLSLNGQPTELHPLTLAWLSAAALAGSLLMRRLGQPNPWVLGALAVTLALGAGGVPLSALPPGLTSVAQVAVGTSLGTRFKADFVRTAPRWLAAVALGTFGMIVLAAGYSWSVARLIGQAPAAMLLGHSPGGITEMCLTAKVLQLGVPLVTAFHVVRFVIVLLLTGPIHARWIAPAARP
ncbi:MAG: hypothetical protein RJA44_1023 [Pseudomonadota bacterium]